MAKNFTDSKLESCVMSDNGIDMNVQYVAEREVLIWHEDEDGYRFPEESEYTISSINKVYLELGNGVQLDITEQVLNNPAFKDHIENTLHAYIDKHWTDKNQW